MNDVLSKLVQLKPIADGGLRDEPPAAGGCGGLGAKPRDADRFFAMFWGKNAILMPLDHISHVFRAI